MTHAFNPLWNPHYDFQDPINLSEIKAVEGYTLDGDVDIYRAGEIIRSPWGTNQVVSVKSEKGTETCIKEIMVEPGFMLSLQRHRGRAELWKVEDGILTVIRDGTLHTVFAGQSISLPLGAVHCMINSSDHPVTVTETQTGICREKDNIRLLDFNGRVTYPLTTETEYRSAKLYAEIHTEHAQRYGFDLFPHEGLLP